MTRLPFVACLLANGCTLIYGGERASSDLAIAGGTDLAGFDLAGIDLGGDDSGSGGVLTGSGQSATGAINLTAEGTSDWAHWGRAAVTDFDHKAAGGSQISNFTVVGAGTTKRVTNLVTYAWTDGTPTVSAPPTASGIAVHALNAGITVTVPADTTQRTLRLYLGGHNSMGRLTAHLSDRSAPDYVDAGFSSMSALYEVEYTLTYRAASAGGTLTLTWIELKSFGGGSKDDVTLQSATLR